MAFLDNSGTIILDAVLTEVGRKRMAQGKFRVTKFALGDDEIDYSLVDVVNDDFDKLLTLPAIESLSAENATINHGLENFTSDDILYMPLIKVNEKIDIALQKYPSEEQFYYISVNEQTTEKLITLLGSNKYFLENYSVERNKLFFESGIDNNTPARDKIGRERYILNYNLLDKYFIINCDNRFIDKLLIIKSRDSYFENDAVNKLYYSFQTLSEVVPISYGKIMRHFNPYIAIGVDNNIYSFTHGEDNEHSALTGPRGTICALNLKLKEELTTSTDGTIDFRFTTFGKTDQILFGGSDKFDHIDTAIHIEGLSSSAKLTIPIRILRYAGT